MIDVELEEWREVWRSESSEAPLVQELQRRVRRDRSRLLLATASEIAVTIAGMAAVASTVRRHGDAPTIAWAAAAVVFFAATWTFALSNRRGVWRPGGTSVREFIALTRERCVRKLRTVRFVIGLLVAEVAFLVPWGVWEWRAASSAERARTSLALSRWAVLAALVVGFIAWTARYRRRALLERAEIDELARAFDHPK